VAALRLRANPYDLRGSLSGEGLVDMQIMQLVSCTEGEGEAREQTVATTWHTAHGTWRAQYRAAICHLRRMRVRLPGTWLCAV
jgi:hypothetical protein